MLRYLIQIASIPIAMNLLSGGVTDLRFDSRTGKGMQCLRLKTITAVHDYQDSLSIVEGS